MKVESIRKVKGSQGLQKRCVKVRPLLILRLSGTTGHGHKIASSQTNHKSSRNPSPSQTADNLDNEQDRGHARKCSSHENHVSCYASQSAARIGAKRNGGDTQNDSIAG